ncbi:hypothetical protein [Thaumasiovibrio subtropicus]|uniref:hypothetical protein n=3 Tax=Thaumasiovibrio subtropicus TaxID=1891207 RepID=UPI001C84BE92|nr:hypothetical protein [Thaumasiovibrio subtropicus]
MKLLPLMLTITMGLSPQVLANDSYSFDYLGNDVGMSVNLLSGELKPSCFDSTSFRVSSINTGLPVTEKSFTYVEDKKSAERFFQDNSDVAIGIPKLSAKRIKSLMYNIHEEEVNKYLLFNYTRLAKNYIIDQNTAELNPKYVSLLNNEDETIKHNFRDECGDGFINQVIGGKALNLAIKYDSYGLTYTEEQNLRTEMSSAFNNLLSINGDDTEIRQLKQKWGSQRFTLVAQALGSELYVSELSIDNIKGVFDSFLRSDNDRFTAFKYDTRKYSQLADHNSSMFIDIYNKDKEILEWDEFISSEFNSKCEPTTTDDTICRLTYDTYLTQSQICSDSNLWGDCKSPIDASCMMTDPYTEQTYRCDVLTDYDVPDLPDVGPIWRELYNGAPTVERIDVDSDHDDIAINGVIRRANYIVTETGYLQCPGGQFPVSASCEVIVEDGHVKGCYKEEYFGSGSQCSTILKVDGRISLLEGLN